MFPSAGKMHGEQLIELSRKDPKVSVVGAVKDTGIDDELLLDFYQNHFHSHPLYLDGNWKIFDALGGKKLSLFTVFRRAWSFSRVMKKKNLKNIVGKGEIWKLGGVLIFNRKGELKFTQFEQWGIELNMQLIEDAIADIRKEQKQKQ